MPHKAKRTYPRLNGKNGVLPAIMRASKRTGQGFRYYWCHEHKGYHMTHQEKR